eukprot:6181146-Pleurochrysis_carterae.AAC.5
MAKKVAKEHAPLDCNTAGCSFSLAGTGGKFKKARASIDEAAGKHAEMRDVCVVGLPVSVGVEVKAAVASDALCELLAVEPLSASSPEKIKVRHRDGLAAASTRVIPFVE